MRRALLGRALAAGVALASLAPGLPAQRQPSPEQTEAPEIRRFRIRGVKHVDQTYLERALVTEASACKSLILTPFCLFTRSPTFVEKHYLDRTEFARDILRIRVYYWERGWRDVEVDTTVAPYKNGVAITVNVKENQPTRISVLRIEYDSTVLSDHVRNRLTRLRAGDPLDLVLLDSMRVGFQNAMWDRGYGDAQADTTILVNREARTAEVGVRVIPNWKTFVGPIVITGNQQVDRKTILNTISLRTGDAFQLNKLLDSQRSLYESNLFRRATITHGTPADSVKTIRIDVAEAPEREARVGWGFNNVDFFQVDGRLTHYNFLGGARRVDVNTTFSNLLAPQFNGHAPFRDIVDGVDDRPQRFLQPTWDASIDFRQPAFLHRSALETGLGVFAHRRQAPGIFVDRGYGAAATLTRTFLARTPVSLNYRFEVTRIEASDVYYCVNFGVCDAPTIGTLRSHQRMSPVTLTGFVDRTDVPLNPSRGYLLRVDLEHASRATASSYQYNRGFLDAAAYTHFRRNIRNVLSGHLRLGLVRAIPADGVLHPRKRFYAGGANSVRGYGENQLGPRILTIDEQQLRGVNITTDPANPLATDTVATRTNPCLDPDISACDPNLAGLKDGDFQPQPLGGTSLAEASVEYRFPLYGRKIDGAVFLDAGVVGEGALQTLQDIRNIARGTGAITPGFGFRYRSSVGPIRVDLGINPKLSEDLPVVTAVMQNGQRHIVALQTPRTYSPGGKTLLDRLTLHLSVGQAY